MAKRSLKSKLVPQASIIDLLHTFLTGNNGCGKSFLMKVMCWQISKTLAKRLSHGNISVDKPRVLFMAATGATVIKIEGTTIHTTVNITVGKLGKKIAFLKWQIEIKFKEQAVWFESYHYWWNINGVK